MRYVIGWMVLCCLAWQPVSAAEPRVVFDVDLTKGSAGPGTVTGGQWGGGWRCTGAKDERIVFDAGGPIANGCLEASFTIAELPWASQQGKINYIGLHEDASLTQNKHEGDLFYARTGNASYKFSNVKAAGRRFDRGEHEPRVGSAEDWIPDNKTVHRVKLEWKGGLPIFHDPKGKATVFPRDVVGGDTPVDRLRYVFLGSDHYTGLTVKGLRFLRVKLIDYGPEASAPPPERLTVSENGRYLTTESGHPVFLLGDTAWSLAFRLTREEADYYLRQRRSQRFNTVTFVLFAPGLNELDKAGKNAYGDAAFAQSGDLADPTRPLITPGNDPADAAAYDYWDHVDYLLERCRQLGLYAIVLPTWGSGVVGSHDGKAAEDIVFNRENAAAYGRWLANRYGQQPHVLWMLGGDRSAVYGDNDYRPVFRAMAAGLAGSGSAASTRQLMSYHPRKDHPNSSAWFHSDAWLSLNSIQDWPEVQLAAVQHDWSQSPAKPTWLFEGRYEGYWKRNYKPEDWGEWQCRQQAWQTVVGGSFGHTYGHERVFGFGTDGADWKSALDSPGARSMTHLAKLMNYFNATNALTRQGDQSLLASEEGKAERLASDRITVSRTANNRCVLAYSAAGRPIRLHMDKLAKGPMFAWWFNPRTGGFIQDGVESPQGHPFAKDIPSGPGAAAHEFDPPGEAGPGQDWVLVVSASEGL